MAGTLKKLQFASGIDTEAPSDLTPDGGDSSLDSPVDAKNYSLTAAVGSSALTITLKSKAGNTPSLVDPVHIAFRNATAATGDYTGVDAVAATSLVISSGSTLGHSNASEGVIYVYAINNAGTIELAASTKNFGASGIVSTTAEGGAGAADSILTMYSTTARSNVAFRMLGRMKSTQTTAGTWAAVPTEIVLGSDFYPYDASVLSNMEATRIGAKYYLHGTSYNGGNAPTITLVSGGGTLNSVERGLFIPYQMQDSSWRLRFNISLTLSATSRGTTIIGIAGVTFKNTTNYYQPVTFSGAGSATAAHDMTYTVPNTGNIELDWAAGNSQTSHHFSGDVELNSKPTWAY